MAEKTPKCRTCDTTGTGLLLDEWVNEDKTITARLCSKCIFKEENDMFWEDCICEECNVPCKLQRHFVIFIREMIESGKSLCKKEGCNHEKCDVKAHLYCHLCQVRILEGAEGVKRLEGDVVKCMIYEDGQRAREAFNSPCSWIEFIVGFSIPVIALAVAFKDLTS